MFVTCSPTQLSLFPICKNLNLRPIWRNQTKTANCTLEKSSTSSTWLKLPSYPLVKMWLFVSNIWPKSRMNYFLYCILLSELATTVLLQKFEKSQPYFILLNAQFHCIDMLSNTVCGHNLPCCILCIVHQVCTLYCLCKFCAKHSVARSGSKIALMHLGLIFMRGFSANLTFELGQKTFESGWKIASIFSFSAFVATCARMRPDCESQPPSLSLS